MVTTRGLFLALAVCLRLCLGQLYSDEEEDVFDQRLDDDFEGGEQDEEDFLEQPPQGEYQVRQAMQWET